MAEGIKRHTFSTLAPLPVQEDWQCSDGRFEQAYEQGLDRSRFSRERRG